MGIDADRLQSTVFRIDEYLPGARTWAFPERAYFCAGSSMVERRVVAAKVKGSDSLPALIRGSSNWLGHQALNLRTLVRIQPPVQVPMRGTNPEKGLQVLRILSGYADRVQGEVSVLHRRVMKWLTCTPQKRDFVGSTPTPATMACAVIGMHVV